MMQRLRSFPALALVVFLVAVVVSQQSSAALELAASYSGSAQIPGPLQLELSVSPAVSTPGDTLSLELRLTNHTKATSSPEVILQIPSGFRLNAGTLPAGTTLNLQTNAINWLPIVPANGGVRQLSLQLRVETADIGQPEKQMTVVLRHEGEEKSASAPIWVGIPPRITGFLNAPQVAVGQPVQLRAEAVGSAPFSQAWHLGDGRLVAVSDPVVVYPAAGIYEVTLEVANPLQTVSRTGSITVVPHPAAQFRPDDPMPGIDQTVSFINESGGQPPLTYTWEFGDGSTSNEADPIHQYGAPGVYRVRLLVQNEYGQSEAFWPVTVGEVPTADLVVDERAAVGQPLSGQAFGDESVTAFRWDMGDGRRYEGEQISHVYGRSGDYYVTMTASNDYGATEVGRWVHVDPGTLSLYLPLILRPGAQSGGTVHSGRAADPLGVVLDPVALDEPFVLEPVELPSSMSPAERLFHYINEVRVNFDLEPLQHVGELSQAAQQHTEDMASYAYAGHTGSDGSLPAERLLWHGYGSSYAGEATAWGFEHPYEAVEYWVNSDAHRRIVLNRNATDVGVGFTVDYAAPNVWYWTAEFGNQYGAAARPLLRVQEPSPGSESMITDLLNYGWNWPVPLAPDQHFTVYVYDDGRTLPLGTTSQRQFGIRYTLRVAALDTLTEAGEYEWQVKLEDSNDNSLLESEPRPITFIPDPNLPTPTPVITATATTTATLATPTPTLTPTPAWSTPTPRPPSPTPAVLVTATPLFTPTPTPTPEQ